jgi:hypothetical protein
MYCRRSGGVQQWSSDDTTRVLVVRNMTVRKEHSFLALVRTSGLSGEENTRKSGARNSREERLKP